MTRYGPLAIHIWLIITSPDSWAVPPFLVLPPNWEFFWENLIVDCTINHVMEKVWVCVGNASSIWSTIHFETWTWICNFWAKATIKNYPIKIVEDDDYNTNYPAAISVTVYEFARLFMAFRNLSVREKAILMQITFPPNWKEMCLQTQRSDYCYTQIHIPIRFWRISISLSASVSHGSWTSVKPPDSRTDEDLHNGSKLSWLVGKCVLTCQGQFGATDAR